MTLHSERIGMYALVSRLGAGGMGEVYRARDTRLGRDVAVKILPDAFTSDPDRLARFEREARLLASLNHPNIATIHGIEDADGRRAIVMELVEGETLAQRIARGPLSTADALAIARQIADALDSAHDKGIVHRDLKPGNIMMTPVGTVKVLDFGVAKATPAESAAHAADAATITTAGTLEGLVLGTPGYMSPEQTRGYSVDKRTDIWAFGCVLYEMLTGSPPFPGATTSDTIETILEHEPDWQRLPAATTSRVRDLLQQCLRKDPKRRLRDAGDAVNLIDDAVNAVAGGRAGTDDPRAANKRLIPLVIAGVALGAAVGGLSAWIATTRSTQSAPAPLVQFIAATTDGNVLDPSGVDRDVAISLDGARLVYVTGGPGRARLVTRAFTDLTATLLWDGGTSRAPFFSPDGKWIGFFDLFGVVKKISITGGPVVEVCRTGMGARGASWSTDDTIVFATGDPGTGLMRVPAAGGQPVVLTRPDVAKGELDHFWPEVLPNGRAVLFTIVSPGSTESAQIAVFDLFTREQKVLVRGGSHGQYVRPGYLIYGAAGGIYALPFDVERLAVTGSAVKVLDQVAITPEGAVNAAVSSDGTLVYARSASSTIERVPVWVTRDGREEPIAAPPRPYVYPRLSPDGTRVALETWDQGRDIWFSLWVIRPPDPVASAARQNTLAGAFRADPNMTRWLSGVQTGQTI